MEPDSDHEKNWSAGTDALVVELYPQLRRIARREHHRCGPGATLQTTALIHESYLKLRRSRDWDSRAHFLACAATAMRHVLIDGARSRLSAKRRLPDLPFDDGPDDIALLRLDDALRDLARLEPDLARLVECRFFGGMSIEETGEALGVSPATVKRGWTMAQAWLHRELTGALGAG